MIRVMPAAQLGGPLPLETVAASYPVSPAADPLAWSARRLYTGSGRAALDAILAALHLAPSDEVFITNSSGQRWVSPCVTSTVFNHAQPSRVLTDATRAMLVIHEFGYPHPRIRELVAEAEARGAVLIEDCAHSLDSTLDGLPLGSFGDVALFSLPKVAPVAAGGVLVTGRTGEPTSRLAGLWTDAHDDDADAAAEAEATYRALLPALPDYSRRRVRNCEALMAAFPDLPLQLRPLAGVTPWYVLFTTPAAREIARGSDAIEWGSTLDADLLLVTTNPFAEAADLVIGLSTALDQVVSVR